MRLRISVNKESNRAVLKFSGKETAWREIRREMQAYSSEVINTEESALTIPWWAFLKATTALHYRIEKYKIEVKFDPEAEKLLVAARTRESGFSRAGSSRRIPPKKIVSDLLRCGFKRKLKWYQLRNVGRLIPLHAGATFSVPGAGKTSEALAFYFLRRRFGTKLLVICPKNAFATWEEQLIQCTENNQLKCERLVGGITGVRKALQSSPEFMLMSYQQVATARDALAELLAKGQVTVFLDESHRIKLGERGEIGRFVLSISHLPEAKLILSGTPMPNLLEDLVPQFGFLFPEIDSNPMKVAAQIKKVYVRTTKAELDLPPITRIAVPIEMAPGQRRLYSLMRSEEIRSAESALRASNRNSFRALGKSVMRLLQATSNPNLLLKLNLPHEDLLKQIAQEGDGRKIEYVCRRARELAAKKQKVLIWSMFIENVELIASRLGDIGADYIHGGVDTGSEDEADTREQKIKRFHEDPAAMVLVANPAACSESISLHRVCHHSIYVDRNYNAAQYMQSEDRIHRLGLAKNQKTTIEILCTPHSIDESVDRRLQAKVLNMAQVLEDPSLRIAPISFDPDRLDNNEELDEDDVQDLLKHLKA